MSPGTAIAVFFIYIVIPSVAFLLSFVAQSSFARIFLRWGGLFFGVVFGLNLFMSGDCGLNDFAYQNCHHAPQPIADIASALSIFSMVLYFFVAPIFAVWALFREMKVRQHSQFDRDS